MRSTNCEQKPLTLAYFWLNIQPNQSLHINPLKLHNLRALNCLRYFWCSVFLHQTTRYQPVQLHKYPLKLLQLNQTAHAMQLRNFSKQLSSAQVHNLNSNSETGPKQLSKFLPNEMLYRKSGANQRIHQLFRRQATQLIHSSNSTPIFNFTNISKQQSSWCIKLVNYKTLEQNFFF